MSVSAKILVVDDEQGMRDMLTYELGNRGYRVVAAPSGEQALAALRQENFQLVISDVKMPGMGGLEALAAIKKINPDVEVIMASGHATIGDAVTAMKRGAYDFIQKPFGIEELGALVERVLEKKELKAVIALYEASKIMFSTIKLDTLLPIIAKSTRAVLRADDVCVALLKEGKLEVAAALGLDGAQRLSARLALIERAAREAGSPAEPVILSGSPEQGVKASLVYPLCANGQALGFLCASRTTLGDPFNSADVRHMAIFGAQISQAVYIAKAFQRVQETQSQLVHSERMNAIGRFAAGIAHEMNNPLTGILGFAEMLLEDPALTAQQRQDIGSISEQTRRCKVILEGLLQFSRKKEAKKEVIAIESLLRSTLRLARLDFAAKKIDVLLEVDDPDAAILADSCQMQQVFLNLIGNAGHALEARTDKRLEIRVESASGRASIRFKDNGCGISSENLARIFEPFFTTKPVGKGTGLGLSICREIISNHDGTIEASSRSEEGTTFTIRLPLHRAARPSKPLVS